jgi:hypothetical protein
MLNLALSALYEPLPGPTLGPVKLNVWLVSIKLVLKESCNLNNLLLSES